jgi:SAM-dependent methyltransferase
MSSRYESLVFEVLGPGRERVLDVGCGNGGLTRELRRRGVSEIVGIDRDEPCIERCKAHPEAGDIRYLAGDVLVAPLEPSSFDLVTAVASLHHMDARAGLTRLRDLVAPGGVLVVVGLARPDFPRDLPIELAALITHLVGLDRHKSDGKPTFPTVWPPPERYSAMRRLATELLPGVRWHRHLRWRYSLRWTNPK